MLCLSTPQRAALNLWSLSLTRTVSSHIPGVALNGKRAISLRLLRGEKWAGKDFSRAAMPSGFFHLSCPPSFLIYSLPSAILLSICPSQLPVCYFFQVYHSLLSVAAGSSRLPPPHVSPTDYTVAMPCFQEKLCVTVRALTIQVSGIL